MRSELGGMFTPNSAGIPVILCVDDEAETLKALQRCFRNEPYRVFTAGSPWEALVWMENLPAVDLVLTDELMPGMAGTELLAVIRDRHPGTARVVFSGYPGEAVIRKSLEAGSGAFFNKPWDDMALRNAVRRLLVGKRAMPPLARGGYPPSDDLGVENE